MNKLPMVGRPRLGGKGKKYVQMTIHLTESHSRKLMREMRRMQKETDVPVSASAVLRTVIDRAL